MEGLNYETETWKIINKYFEDNPYFLTNHHLESFNDFIDNKIPETLKQINPIRNFKEYDNSRNSYKYQIDIYFGTKSNDKIYIGNPIIYDKNNGSRQLFPNEARIRNLDYSSSLCCDVEVIFKIFDGDRAQHRTDQGTRAAKDRHQYDFATNCPLHALGTCQRISHCHQTASQTCEHAGNDKGRQSIRSSVETGIAHAFLV